MSLSYPLILNCQRVKLGEGDEQEHKSQASQWGLECVCDGSYEWNHNSKAVWAKSCVNPLFQLQDVICRNILFWQAATITFKPRKVFLCKTNFSSNVL